MQYFSLRPKLEEKENENWIKRTLTLNVTLTSSFNYFFCQLCSFFVNKLFDIKKSTWIIKKKNITKLWLLFSGESLRWGILSSESMNCFNGAPIGTKSVSDAYAQKWIWGNHSWIIFIYILFTMWYTMVFNHLYFNKFDNLHVPKCIALIPREKPQSNL